MGVIKKTLMTCGLTMLLSSAMLTTKSLATETKDFTKYPNDVTAPWGRVSIESGTAFNNITYVEDRNITVKIYAADDKCALDEIQFALSFSSLTGTTITDWNKLADGNEVQLTLPDATNAHQIYAAFKDYNGNISIVSTVTNQTVTYNLNGGSYNGSTANLTGVDSTRYYGAPFVITEKMPSKDGVSFIGWSTDPAATEASYHAGQIILPEMVIGSSTDATLYAVYTTEAQGYLKLSEVVDVGDYVNYPVDYTNVATFDNTYIAKFNGWRVLSVSGDEVNLVSAGVPMTYYHVSNINTSITNLAINFLETSFSSTAEGYRTSGFDPSKTLTEIFTNKYTATYESDTQVSYPGYNTTLTGTKTAGTLKVRSMTNEDLEKVSDSIVATTSGIVSDEKYNYLLAVPANIRYCCTWLASAAYDSRYLDNVDYTGNVKNYHNDSKAQGVRPVVTLKADVLATGKDAIGAWNITIGEQFV